MSSGRDFVQTPKLVCSYQLVDRDATYLPAGLTGCAATTSGVCVTTRQGRLVLMSYADGELTRCTELQLRGEVSQYASIGPTLASEGQLVAWAHRKNVQVWDIRTGTTVGYFQLSNFCHSLTMTDGIVIALQESGKVSFLQPSSRTVTAATFYAPANQIQAHQITLDDCFVGICVTWDSICVVHNGAKSGASIFFYDVSDDVDEVCDN